MDVHRHRGESQREVMGHEQRRVTVADAEAVVEGRRARLGGASQGQRGAQGLVASEGRRGRRRGQGRRRRQGVVARAVVVSSAAAPVFGTPQLDARLRQAAAFLVFRRRIDLRREATFKMSASESVNLHPCVIKPWCPEWARDKSPR